MYPTIARSARGLLLLAIVAFASGCGGSDSTSPSPSTSSAAYSQTDLTVGTGAVAVIGRPVTVDYTGWLYDSTRPDGKGTQFDTSIGRGPFTFTLGGGSVIAGWDRGVANMRVGGQRRLVIPPELAYGSQGRSPIPPNATLVFDITLLGVQ
jgi:FKBP-type peptidyl-prolyl cis-trans isomerase FkpA